MAKVLVADDSITVRKVAERLLTEAGMEVALAASGEEAMAYLATERPDFVISDVIMPDKTGYDVCRFVRAHAVLAQTPVLLISGIVNDEVNRQAESCQANGVLKKPFQGSSLQERVRELLSPQTPAEPSTPPALQDERSPVSDASLTPEDGSFAVVGGPDSAPSPSSQKAYRITEDQLHSFKQSAARIKALEEELEAARATVARMSDSAHGPSADRSHVADIESALIDAQKRAEELAEQAAKASKAERRVQELEAVVAELQSRATEASQGPTAEASVNHPSVTDLQALLSDQQQRLSELARELMRYGDGGERVQGLETALAEEQARANGLATRCLDLEQALARANGQVEELTGLLGQISRLAGSPMDARPIP